MEIKRVNSIYNRWIKRGLDAILSLMGIIALSPVFVVLFILVSVKLGNPVLFKQKRPGLNGEIFTLYKFRTMTDEKDENGKLKSDEERLTSFGKMLRSTSLDELPELFNILKGEMSIVGPRPQLVRDMTFMTEEENKRHLVRPGLTGLAQANGRNSISWEEKFKWDLVYLNRISLIEDIKILLLTVKKVFIKEGINAEDMATAEDLGDYLLRTGKVTKGEYDLKQQKAIELLNR